MQIRFWARCNLAPIILTVFVIGMGLTYATGAALCQKAKPLTLEDKIGQMLQIRIFGDYQGPSDPAYRTTIEQIRRYHVGSVVLGGRMAGPNLSKGSPTGVAAILNNLQRQSPVPLLVGSDIERGLASRLTGDAEFPFPMAFGAVGDQEVVRRFGAITAKHARAVGIHWAYAPDADVNSNPLNPIINTRAFGETPEQVSELVAAYIRGAHENGMLVAPKHFPGHGDSAADSHIGIVRVTADRAHLNRFELPPFKAAIAAGADAIMLAHASVPALDPDPKRIATTSPKIVDGVLRRELGFRGLVVTDALEMRGLTELYPGDPNPSGRAAVDAIKAGADILMIPQDLDGAFKAILAAVQSGEIPESRIDESVRRILAVKESLGLNKSRFVDVSKVADVANDPEASNFAQQVSDGSITLVKNSGQLLPLVRTAPSPTTSPNATNLPRLVVVTFSDSFLSHVGRAFDQQVLLRRPDAKIIHVYNDGIRSPSPLSVMAAIKDADQVIVAAFVTHVPGRRVLSQGRAVVPVGLMGQGAEILNQVISTKPKQTIVIALGSPYLITGFPEIQNYICTYSLAPTAEISAAKSLFGEIKNNAHLPVTIPGIAQRGTALQWPTSNEANVRHGAD